MKRTITYGFIIGMMCVSPVTRGQNGHRADGWYTGIYKDHIAYPIGGMGTGMFCLEGTGALTHMSVRHHPDMFNAPVFFAALYVKGKGAKVLEGPVPSWKIFGGTDAGSGGANTGYGLPRYQDAAFYARFPFGMVKLKDQDFPVSCTLTGWSPFIPTDADNSSLPVGGLECRLTNTTTATQSGVFSINAKNFMAEEGADDRIKKTEHGFVLSQDGSKSKPELQGDFAVFTDDPHATVNYCWYRGEWFDPLTMAWKKISTGDNGAKDTVAKEAPGASLYVPYTLRPGESKTVRIYVCWDVPYSHLRTGYPLQSSADSSVADRSGDQPSPYYMPWYASRFKNINEVIAYWKNNYDSLKQKTQLFTKAFYNSTLPPEVLEAVGDNLTILKSTTVLRQYDGRFWGWEGSNDNTGSCAGNCTHVYNYAQALCHLFPDMERSIRETEFGESQAQDGHQNYRAALPIRPAGAVYLPAADGQLGSIMRVYRDWRISGDDNWLRNIYPKVKTSLDYCIKTWDPDHKGTISEPHHNTYDIEFWGADGMCTGFYLGALEAFISISNCLHEDTTLYSQLLAKGKTAMQTKLWNGKYFIQNIEWKDLHAADPGKYPDKDSSPEAIALIEKEGPQYQYGKGCLSDGVIGPWIAKVCGLPDPVDENKVKAHLQSIYQYNYTTDLSSITNPQRPTFGTGHEGGLLLCSWPNGGALSLPFPYSNEVWTGVEFEVASHLMFEGQLKQGMNIVKTTLKRYDGRVRNPFDEYEAGNWYMRAMSSYALLEALTGVHYDAVSKTLFVHSKTGDFTSFLSTNTGFGNVIYKNGKASLKTVYGKIDVEHIQTNAFQ